MRPKRGQEVAPRLSELLNSPVSRNQLNDARVPILFIQATKLHFPITAIAFKLCNLLSPYMVLLMFPSPSLWMIN